MFAASKNQSLFEQSLRTHRECPPYSFVIKPQKTFSGIVKVMRKIKQKTVVLLSIVILPVSMLIGYNIMQHNNPLSPVCRDIFGDGYAMGTDPEPVVIGRNCGL